jgi:peptide deformylase
MIKLIEPEKIENITCEKITQENYEEILSKSLIKEMYKLYSKLGGVGLAAPQVGIFYSFFVMFNGEEDYKLIINPAYENPNILTKKSNSLEGCLSYSLGKETYNVLRYPEIKASWQELKNNRLVDKIDLLELSNSIVFQHETDHCNGITIKMIGNKFSPIGLPNSN